MAIAPSQTPILLKLRYGNSKCKLHESYYLGEKKAHPDLAIEIALTCGGKAKLEKYKRFGINEVWFWENERLSVYRFRGGEYEEVSRSELLPELNLELLVRCAKMPVLLEAVRAIQKGIGRDCFIEREVDRITIPNSIKNPVSLTIPSPKRKMFNL